MHNFEMCPRFQLSRHEMYYIFVDILDWEYSITLAKYGFYRSKLLPHQHTPVYNSCRGRPVTTHCSSKHPEIAPPVFSCHAENFHSNEYWKCTADQKNESLLEVPLET